MAETGSVSSPGTPDAPLLTPEEARRLPAGRVLDVYVSAGLAAMGLPEGLAASRWSSDARAVAMLIDLLTSVLNPEPWAVVVCCDPCRRPKWTCHIDGPGWEAEGEGNTLSLAFCRAFLHEQEEMPDG